MRGDNALTSVEEVKGIVKKIETNYQHTQPSSPVYKGGSGSAEKSSKKDSSKKDY